MNKTVFFDVDCLEVWHEKSAPTRPVFDGMGFRPRVEPIAERLNNLYRLIVLNDRPMFFCTCCSGNLPEKDFSQDMLFISRNEPITEIDRFDDKKLIYVEKKTTGIPKQNYEQCCFDPFRHNHNLNHVIDKIGAERWVVFGNGFDLCVMSVIRGLIKQNKEVFFVHDLIVRGAKGYDNLGTEEYWLEAMEELNNCGVTLISYADLIMEMQVDQ